MAEAKIVTLSGKDVLQVSVDATQQHDKNGKAYYRARYAGKTFTIDEDTFNDFKAGEIESLTLSENEYQVEDPENVDAKLTRVGWAYSGHATYKQISAIEGKQGELALGRKRYDVQAKKLDIEVLKLEQQAMAEVKLGDKEVATLQEVI